MEGAEVKELLQVSYASAFDDLRERELKSLLRVARELEPRRLTLITWDYEDEKTIDGHKIGFVPLWKWLLSRTHRSVES
jgi:hypothetical protein